MGFESVKGLYASDEDFATLGRKLKPSKIEVNFLFLMVTCLKKIVCVFI